jgi:uncharacterized repeat protein (TIGR03843 family)
MTEPAADPATEPDRQPELPADAVLELLTAGAMELEGLLAEASNTTLRAFVERDGVRGRCVYKPVRGERPLWDFPDGTLAGREVAAYLVSRATGWDVVPPTVLRDGPAGPGACQWWIDSEPPDELVGFVPVNAVPDGWCPVASARGPGGERYVLAHASDERLARMAVLDAVLNNADRKGAHLLLTTAGRVHGVDHGVTFHREEKLRTVLWGWAGRPLPADTVETLGRLRDGLAADLGETLAEHLTRAEVRATLRRVNRLLDTGRYPMPPEDWPALPWPPV